LFTFFLAAKGAKASEAAPAPTKPTTTSSFCFIFISF